MIKSDFHTHTNFCDGNDSVEKMIISAINKGMDRIGLCVHSYQFFDDSFCVAEDKVDEFINTCILFKEKYKEKIKVFCGVEQEYFSEFPTDKFDYVIGSVHYVKYNDLYLDVDLSKDAFVEFVNKYFDGDYYSFCEEYFSLVSKVCEKTKCDIIGHFDLVTKFNENYCLFDEKNPRYVTEYKKAIDSLVKYKVPFEINTGAISRGYRTKPYPCDDIIDYIISKGGKFILSSDAHNSESIGFEFDALEEKLKGKNILLAEL